MRLKFDELPRTVRERIVELSTKPSDPRVLIAATDMRGGWFKYFTLVAGAGAVIFCLNFLLERLDAGIHPRHDQEVFLGMAGGLFLIFVSIASIAFARVFPPPPYQTGTWALTSYLMRLTRGWVELMPLSELGKPTIVTVLRNGSYSGSRLEFGGGWTFYFSSKTSVEESCNKVLAARQAFSALVAAKDARALQALDVFFDCTLSGSWKAPSDLDLAEGPKSPLVPGALRAAQWFGSLAAGGVVAGVAFQVFAALHRGHP